MAANDSGPQPVDSSVPFPNPQEGTHTRYRCYLCSRTYERQDHLSRHLKSHDNERNYRCPDCGKGFNRADLLNRHRAAHARSGVVETFRRRTGKACEACIRAKTKCDDERPCKRCKTRGTPCIPTESHRGRPSDASVQPGSPNLTSRDDDAARTTISLSHHASEEANFGDLNGYGNGQDDLSGNNIALDDFGFSDFFENIMMPGIVDTTNHEPLMAPPDVSNFTQDVDLGPLDFDFSFLASGLTRPSTAQGLHDGERSAGEISLTPQSDAHLRSEAFKKSPWSWNHWIPDRSHNTFSGQDEINVVEQRVSTEDQLTPMSERRFHCGLENEARDRMIRVVTQAADSRLAVPSFPSLELLEDLIDVFLLQESNAIDAFIHAPSFNSQITLTELLLGIVAAGATYIALPPVWKMGLVIQEVVRVAIVTVFERDNSTTRELEPLQAYLLWLKVGIWSGFRRKTEIASSFLQPAITMLSWSNAFAKFRYKDIIPNIDDDDEALTRKWKAWIEQESFKRIVIHAFIYDSQVAIAHLKNPLVSPAQMQLPLPGSRDLWLAQNAHSWRNLYLSVTRPVQSALPAVMAIAGNIGMLENMDHVTDKQLCILIACHSVAHEVFQCRQQALLLANAQNQSRRDRWLAHVSRQKDLHDDLSAMHTYCELQPETAPEALFTLEYLMMSLYVSLDDIQLFSGRSGEEEARRVYPQIRAWTEEAGSRIAVWHAGQVLRMARTFEKTKLRDFYAVALYHSTLTLWVYGMVTANAARKSGVQTPAAGRQSHATTNRLQSAAASQLVLLDGEDNKAAKAFRHLRHGKPCLQRSPGSSTHTNIRLEAFITDTCSLQNSKGVMLLAAELLKSNYPRSRSGLPPLVENLANLMSELAKLSGRNAS